MNAYCYKCAGLFGINHIEELNFQSLDVESWRNVATAECGGITRAHPRTHGTCKPTIGGEGGG